MGWPDRMYYSENRKAIRIFNIANEEKTYIDTGKIYTIGDIEIGKYDIIGTDTFGAVFFDGRLDTASLSAAGWMLENGLNETFDSYLKRVHEKGELDWSVLDPYGFEKKKNDINAYNMKEQVMSETERLFLHMEELNNIIKRQQAEINELKSTTELYMSILNYEKPTRKKFRLLRKNR